MLSSIFTGVVAASVVGASYLIQHRIGLQPAPVIFIFVAILASALHQIIRYYDGLADLMIHIHSPSHPDTSLRWALRGILSFLLLLSGAPVGAEGPAVEFAQSLAIQTRASTARW